MCNGAIITSKQAVSLIIHAVTAAGKIDIATMLAILTRTVPELIVRRIWNMPTAKLTSGHAPLLGGEGGGVFLLRAIVVSRPADPRDIFSGTIFKAIEALTQLDRRHLH